ncbi:LysR family transcriptional regulator [Marinobacterium aestuarii]|uniref:LysR family transcriptional regulator n=1 Tax=Marinobacterium aestuarii TaxID=1821621 RepID=A0A1A9EUW0_9GAMM|nr:LysR substrate-binding domain-containing protein [Marinobacterium aestuarii]ANG61696.1 LysR family transcriptional regulator [Marinobacterium aestuarii]
MKNNWELVDLSVFCAVVKCGSFTEAAKELGYSGPYVSKRIADLETKLGARLFNRTTRSIQITPEGQIAHAWACKILDATQAMARDVANSKTSPTGSLRISTSLRLGRNHVAPILSQLVRDHPGLDVWLELVDRRVDLLEEGIDIDIRSGGVDEPHLVSQLVVESARILCATPEYLARQGTPKVLTDLSQHQCMLFRDGDYPFGSWRLNGPNGLETVRVSGNVLRSHHSDVVKNWALDGQGVILLSEWDAAASLRDGSFVRVLPQYSYKVDIWAVTQARLSHSARMKVCVDYLVEKLRVGPFALDTM